MGGLLLAAALAAGCGVVGGGPDRIVLVTIDTLRADHVGAYGDLSAETPNLDRLAAEGVRFAHAVAPTPMTLPSHTSIMSALDPPGHGARHNSVFSVGPEVPLLAERLRDRGYGTAAFVAAFVLHGRFGLSRGFDVYDDAVGQRRAARGPFAVAERRGDQVVDAALAWLATAPDRFFLWVHLYDPHADYQPPEPYRETFSNDPYAGEIAFADAQVGRLVEAITGRFGPEDLVVAVTSDHGESLGEHGEPTHSYTVYDATQLVPLIVVGEGLPRGRVVDAQVRLVDVAPTLLELAGAAAFEGADGRSLLPLVRGDEGDGDARVAYVETLATQLEMGWSPLLGVRTPRFKYIRAPQPELYDLREDPRELRNLALVREDEAAGLDALLAERLADARPVVPTLQLQDEDRARLESLGYVMPSEELLDRDELGVVGGPNPRDHIRDVAILQEATTLIAEGRPERALERLERVPSGGTQVARARAAAALAAGKPEVAVEAMAAVQARGAASASDLVLLGMAQLSAGSFDEARKTFEAARGLGPATFGGPLGLALLAEEEGRYDDAERWLDEAEGLAPQPDAVRMHRAVLELRRGDLDAADALLAEVGDSLLDPTLARKLALAESEVGRPDRAVEVLRASLEGQPEHRQLLSSYAVALESEGRLEEALRIWRRLHALAPDDAAAKNDLAWGLAITERELDQALSLVREAISAMGDDPALLDTLATVQLARGEPQEALEAARRGLAGASEELQAHLLYVRAAALAALDRSEEARQSLEALRPASAGLASPWRERAAELAKALGVAWEATPPG